MKRILQLVCFSVLLAAGLPSCSTYVEPGYATVRPTYPYSYRGSPYHARGPYYGSRYVYDGRPVAYSRSSYHRGPYGRHYHRNDGVNVTVGLPLWR